MSQKSIPRQLSRRDFLLWGARGALVAAATGGALSALGRYNPSLAAPALPPQMLRHTGAALPAGQANTTHLRLAATDGFVSLPGRRLDSPKGGIYVFGFIAGTMTDTIADLINKYKGKVRMPSPIIGVTENEDVYITLTNLGLEVRPDLDDAHTIHWHGFRNPNSIFDGVPEVSISVPVARNFPYFFRPRDEGTYMYHCHFEDTEHVQMGMDGIVFVRPQPGGGITPYHAYADLSTAFDREYTLLLNEIDTRPHDNLAQVQEFVWSDYKPNYWVINGRAYPDTLYTDQDLASGLDATAAELKDRQPVSSLVQAYPGERILLRMACLGYEQHAMQLLGLNMTVVGHDATYLGSQKYNTHTIYIGPGEARDAIFVAPGYNAALPGGTDAAGDYNVYWLKNRNYQRLVNNDQPGMGGMMTQVRVYNPTSTPGLGTQTRPNQTFPTPAA
jgi:FtsP/CotA-like multicopper oxidase with cupredoxin domain